jgi:hypothetical protein
MNKKKSVKKKLDRQLYVLDKFLLRFIIVIIIVI